MTTTSRCIPTEAQLDAVTVVIDEATREQFYLVQSATDATVTYQVRYNHRYNRWSCQCKGNAAGYTCWHMRAALEIGRQHAEAYRALAEAAKRERLETLKRVMAATPARYSEADIRADQKRFAPRAFSLLR